MIDCRSDVLDGQIFRRCLHDVRTGGDSICGARPGRQARSHGLHLSAHDQVHLPQVRCFWRGGETRRALHPATQHCQREDLHFHVVLVLNTRHPLRPGCRLPSRDNHQSPDARLPPLHTIPAHQARGHQHHRQKEQDGRLVPLLHAGPERRQYYLQRSHARASPEAGPSEQRLWPRH